MEAPKQITPKSIDDYLEQLSKVVFQAGISWRVVDAKWPGIAKAFHRFNVERVARMSDREIDDVANDERVIRSRPKNSGPYFVAVLDPPFFPIFS